MKPYKIGIYTELLLLLLFWLSVVVVLSVLVGFLIAWATGLSLIISSVIGFLVLQAVSYWHGK